ncbi:MAG: peptidylprolyl isomerase [Eubacteriales bacterium]|nr:peptidylprolyl isomerase [Eubacteriales bacterium]
MKSLRSKFTQMIVCSCLPLLILSSACHRGEEKVDQLQRFQRTEKVTNYVVLSIDQGRPIVLELYPESAPETVANFQKLIQDNFYKGLTFFRCVPNFVIQGGDVKGDGSGRNSWTIVGEFAANGFNNPIHHERGVVSMSRLASDNNSASSQFFIVTDNANSADLDGNYAAFGRVISGMDEVDRIASLEVDGDRLLTPVKITDSYFVEAPSES